MASTLPISTWIAWAKISQYLASNDRSKSLLFDSGSVDASSPALIFVVRRLVEFAYNNNPNDPTLNVTGPYLYSIISKYVGQASQIYSGSGCVAPVITANPTTQTVGAGGNVTFVTGATGTNLTYQWQKNDVNITGATLSTYTINGLVSGDAGNYRNVVTNGCGSASTTEAVLTVGAGDIIGYYYFGNQDFFAALNGGTDAVPYIDTFPIVDGQDLSVPILDIYTDNMYNVVKYPSTQGVKINYDNHVPNQGSIPGPNYQSIVAIGSWNYIISRVALSLNSAYPILFKA